MVAELSNDMVLWIPDTTDRQEDYSAVAKAATATTVALDTKARAAQGTVVQLKSELAQSQQSRIEAKVLHAIALKPPSEFGAYAVVGWMLWFGVPTLAGGSAGCSNARTTYDPADPRTTRSTGRGSVDHRHRRLEDDGGSSRGRYSSI